LSVAEAVVPMAAVSMLVRVRRQVLMHVPDRVRQRDVLREKQRNNATKLQDSAFQECAHAHTGNRKATC
jgi:hypothetical protein